jgi:small conductance mechanosensitive channel
LNLATLVDDIFVTAAQFITLILFFVFLDYLTSHIFALLQRTPQLASFGDSKRIRSRVRSILLLCFLLCAAALLIFNTLIMVRGGDVWSETLALLSATVPPEFWARLGWGAAQTALLAGGVWLINRLVARVLPLIERRVLATPILQREQLRLRNFFEALASLIRGGLWFYVVVLGSRLIGLPNGIVETLAIALRIYLIIAGGQLLVRTIAPLVDTLDRLSERYLPSQILNTFYSYIRSLVPLLSRTLEALIYIQAISLALSQVRELVWLADYGTRITQIIVIFFFGRVAIEVIYLLIDKLFLVRGELTDGQWQQRVTFGPLLKSVVKYAVFFGGALLVLTVVGFDIGPVLIGLGGVGLVLGLAAQPVTTDLISGLFILFENLYLVGDYIETGNARGVVESIDIRTTRIRDPDGQLHLIRNGQIGDIVNYSKGYVYAVVMVTVAYDVDLERAYGVIRDTGDRLNIEHDDVLEATQVQGVEEFDDGRIKIRTATRVKPGRHLEMSRAFRTAIKDAFQREEIAMVDNNSVTFEPKVLLMPRPLAEA